MPGYDDICFKAEAIVKAVPVNVGLDMKVNFRGIPQYERTITLIISGETIKLNEHKAFDQIWECIGRHLDDPR